MSYLGEGVLGGHRPHGNLLTYFLFESLLLGPLFPFLLPRFLRYRTLRYEFDEEGVSMRWGALFRREISLTYGRIQDIHLASNLVERRLGLARIQVQTASGSASAEMIIEGLQNFEQVRDFLYTRMRGARGMGPRPESDAKPAENAVAAALLEAAAELRAVREALSAGRAAGPRPESGGARAGAASTTRAPASTDGSAPLDGDGSPPGELPG